MKFTNEYYHIRIDTQEDEEYGTFHVKRKFANISNPPSVLVAVVYSKSLSDFIVEACNEKERLENE